MGCVCCDCWPELDGLSIPTADGGSSFLTYVTNAQGAYSDLANFPSYPATNIAGRYEWKYDAASGINFNSVFTANGITYRGGTVLAGGLGELGVDYRWIYERANSANYPWGGNMPGAPGATLASYTPANCNDENCVRCVSYNDNGFGSGVGQGCLATGLCPDNRWMNRYRYRIFLCSPSGLVDFTDTAVRPGLWPTSAQCSAASVCVGGATYDNDSEEYGKNNRLNYYNQFCDDCSCDDDLVGNQQWSQASYFLNGMPGASSQGTLPTFGAFPPPGEDTPTEGKPAAPKIVSADGGANGFVVGAKMIPGGPGTMHDKDGAFTWSPAFQKYDKNGNLEWELEKGSHILTPDDVDCSFAVMAKNVWDEKQAEINPEDLSDPGSPGQGGDVGPSDHTEKIRWPSDPDGPPRRTPLHDIDRLSQWEPHYYNDDKPHRPGTGIRKNPD